MDRGSISGVALAVVGVILIAAGLARSGSTADPLPVGAASTADDLPVADASSAAPSPAPTVTPSPSDTFRPSPSPTPAPVATPAPDPVAFYAAFGAAIRDGDAAFLFERLHPAVLERYGEDQCRAYVGAVQQDDFTVTVEEVGEPAPWTWTLDERSTVIDEALPVAIVVAAGGQQSAQEAHLAVADGELRWFTDCGEVR